MVSPAVLFACRFRFTEIGLSRSDCCGILQSLRRYPTTNQVEAGYPISDRLRSASSSDPDQYIIWGDCAGDRFEPGRRDPVHVLDMKAHAPRDHVERLHGAGDVGLQYHAAGIGDVGLLVDGLPDTVAQELQCGLDAARAQVIDISAVEVGNRGARLEHGLAGLARSDHRAPDIALLAGRLAQYRRARHVRAVLRHVTENLNAQHVAFLDLLPGRRAI